MAKSGHPTLQRQAEIDDIVQFYFERDVGIWECRRKTGLGFRTIRSRYIKFSDILAKQKDEKFLVEQDRAKNRALTAFDKQLTELISIQQQIGEGVNLSQKQAKDDKRPMTKEEIKPDIRTKLAWMIGDMTDKKAGLELTPTVAEKVRKEVKEYVEKYQRQSISEEVAQSGR